MTPIRAATCLAVIFLHFPLAGCDKETGGSKPDPDFTPESIAVYAPEDAGRVDLVMREFQSTSGIGYSFVSRDAAEPMSRADVYFGESFVDLWEMAEADLLRPVAVSLNERVAAGQLTDPDRRFIPLATVPRAVVSNPTLVSDDEIRTITNFTSLADDRWKGRLCLSSSRVDGNRLLVAHLIRRFGVREAELIVRHWKANVAASEIENDSALLAAIAGGRCEIGILDTGVGNAGIWRNRIAIHQFAANSPLLLDIRGAGISRHANNAEAAGKLLEWLLTAEGNSEFTGNWQEAPLSRELQIAHGDSPEWILSFESVATLSELGFLLEEADLLVERTGYR